MAFDQWLRKLVPGVSACLLLVATYLQASACVSLAMEEILSLDMQPFLAADSRSGLGEQGASVGRTRSARALLENNIFDHTVDLLPAPEAALAASSTRPALDLSDPLSAVLCEGVDVVLVTEALTPRASLAVLQVPGDARPVSRRVGEPAGAFELVYIGFNRLEASPAVWLIKDATLCQALLFGVPAKLAAETQAGAAKETSAAAKDSARKNSDAAGGLAPEIARRIERVSDTEFNLERSVVDDILERQAELMRNTRVTAVRDANGKAAGIRMLGLRPESVLSNLGLQNGDQLETINGFNLGNPEEALNAYARLRSASKLSVRVARQGAPVTLELNIR
jgi:general secretion pathway protein C